MNNTQENTISQEELQELLELNNKIVQGVAELQKLLEELKSL